MFGPNRKPKPDPGHVVQHRSKEYTKLQASLTQDLLGLTPWDADTHDVLFVPGSATAAIEAVLASSVYSVSVGAHYAGEFGKRWHSLAAEWDAIRMRSPHLYKVSMGVQYETSTSTLSNEQCCIVDGVSAFPYHTPRDDLDVYIATTGKQLPGPPGVGIVFIRRSAWSLFFEMAHSFSYLNLSRYRAFILKDQTPTTPPIQVLHTLYQGFWDFDVVRFRRYVYQMYADLIDVFVSAGRYAELMAPQSPPVLTLGQGVLSDKFVAEWELYRTGSGGVQVFTWTDNPYIEDPDSSHELWNVFLEQLYKELCK